MAILGGGHEVVMGWILFRDRVRLGLYFGRGVAEALSRPPNQSVVLNDPVYWFELNTRTFFLSFYCRRARKEKNSMPYDDLE